jgi:hypothetical protein
MATDHILTLLLTERDKLTAAIEALRGSAATETVSVKKIPAPAKTTAHETPVKRKLSAAGRRAIIAATKKRWAAIRAGKLATVAAPETRNPAPAKAPRVAKQAKKKSSAQNAAFRKKMSERMKAAWAARKKKSAAAGK